VKAESGRVVVFAGSPASGVGPSLAGMLAAEMREVHPEPSDGWWLSFGWD